jgi:uncharacterized protein (TIGR03437 family)
MKGNMMIAILPAIPVLLFGYAEGPPDSVSGAPGENTCTKCHGGSPNIGKGGVSITLPGASYVPNQTYPVQVTVSDPNAFRWGFELTVRPDGSPLIEAGTLASTDGMTQTISVDALQWIEHTVQGTRLGTRQAASFQFDWVAPAAGKGTIVFYAASVAANGDGTSAGDMVYVNSLKVPVAPPAMEAPSFTTNLVADAWTGQPGIAPGAWITITGVAMADAETNWSPVAGNPLPTTLGGVSVTVNDTPAVLSHVSATSVTLLVPGSVNGDSAKIVIQRNGISGNPVWVPITSVLPAIYSMPDPNASPTQYYASVTTAGVGMQLSVVNPKGAILGNSTVDVRAVRGVYPSELIDIYATGLGATSPDFPADRLITSARTVAGSVSVHFGATIAAADSAMLVEPGMYVVRVRVPSTVDPGMVPLALDVNGLANTATVLLKVDSNPAGSQ